MCAGPPSRSGPDTGAVVCEANQLITPLVAQKITKVFAKTGRETLKIRTVLSCRSRKGVCAKCYGGNMATGREVQRGEAVGIIAAQSIGEPGTQLTMRTFHTGGVASDQDITQGLPRVEELFEARKPKGQAIITEFGGTVSIDDTKKGRELKEVVITDTEGGRTKSYMIPYGYEILVREGETIPAGAQLTKGSVNPHDILRINGIRAVQDYMLQEVQRVYRLQGVEINDKHIEIIVRQMMKKITIDDPGDSDWLPGESVDVLDFDDRNRELEASGLQQASGSQVILGITKAALATNSFLSAASFQETTKVLTEAAINGRVDPLLGLKENVIIGKLIPAGTGMKLYSEPKLDCDAMVSVELARKKAEMERARQEEEAARRRVAEEARAKKMAAAAAQAADAESEEAPADDELFISDTAEPEISDGYEAEAEIEDEHWEDDGPAQEELAELEKSGLEVSDDDLTGDIDIADDDLKLEIKAGEELGSDDE